MLISFVIPLYQVKKKDFLRCLDSIYRQATQYDKFEVICVDDCSPDADTSIYVSEYKINGIAPSNLFLVRHDINKRQGGARNTAIKVSNGDFVFLIDQDDFLYDGAIEI
ncbi:MAG: glycosyltransferase family 2 protein [Muribaculaceae bacterium]|nr:glycosyltransferase family 2 protein [Muribaculaceae bacterium]